MSNWNPDLRITSRSVWIDIHLQENSVCGRRIAGMKNRHMIIALVIAIALATFGNVTDAQNEYKGRNKPMGYCFDAAFDQKSGRLFVAAGDIGNVVSGGRTCRGCEWTEFALAMTERGLDVAGEDTSRPSIRKDEPFTISDAWTGCGVPCLSSHSREAT